MKPSQNQLREGVQAVCNHARMQASGPHPLLAVTAQYAAPALYAFCRWVVDTAAARSWQRLYFLSRDGYWMRMLCEEISRTLGLELECRYLYASRMAWRAPCFHLAGEEGWEQLFQPAPGITLLGALGRLGLSREEASHWADLAGIPPEERERPLSREEMNGCRLRMQHHRGFAAFAQGRSQEAFRQTEGYFRQEGLLDGRPVVLVDTGWTGSMQRSLRMLLEHMGRSGPLAGLYFGLYRRPVSPADGEYRSWYFAPDSPVSRIVKFNNNVLEALCAAPHPMAVGYTCRAGEYVPRFRPGEEPEASPLFLQREAILMAFCREMLAKAPGLDAGCLEKEVRRRLEKLCWTPTRQEAMAFSGVLFCGDTSESARKSLVRPLSREQAAGFLFHRRLQNRGGANPEPHFWPCGSLAVSRLPQKSRYRRHLYWWETAWNLRNRKGGS